MQPHEAVALAQSVIATLADDLNVHAECGPPTIETVHIAADGTVSCPGCATPSVFEIGLFLDSMLPHGSWDQGAWGLAVHGCPRARRGRRAPVRLRRGGLAGLDAVRRRGFAHGRRRPIRARVSFANNDDGTADRRDARAAPHDHLGDRTSPLSARRRSRTVPRAFPPSRRSVRRDRCAGANRAARRRSIPLDHAARTSPAPPRGRVRLAAVGRDIGTPGTHAAIAESRASTRPTPRVRRLRTRRQIGSVCSARRNRRAPAGRNRTTITAARLRGGVRVFANRIEDG